MTNDTASSKIYDKCNHFDFELVNFPFLVEKCLAPLPMVYDIFRMQFIRFSRVCFNVNDFNNRNQILSAKLLKHKLRKAFSKVYHRHSEWIFKYNIG